MNARMLGVCVIWLVAITWIPFAQAAPDAPTTGSALVLEINGAIGPATSRYVTRGIETAAANGATVVVLQMDTPGGLDSSMRDIIRAILASPIPVVSYVTPSGARAASAGTYILYASHVAAMAPATNLGAATPVSIGGESGGDSPTVTKPTDSKPADSKQEFPQPSTALERKAVNDAEAYKDAALQQKVVDVIATDLPDLFTQIDGREVKVAQQTTKLATHGLTVVHAKPDWRTELLAVITNPSIAYGLMLIGIYGLLLEGYNPGAFLPGVVGVICLVLALFAFQILSVNYAGLALVGLGIGLIIAEFHVHSFGSLGLGGLIAFVIGSLILFDTDVPGMNIGLPLIGAVATVGGLSVIGIVWLAARSRGHRVVSGVQGMLGESAEAVDGFAERGVVRYGGELWKARSSQPVQPGQAVRIAKVEGLTLWVEPL